MPFSDPNHPLWKPENLRRAIHAAGVALWSWNVTNDRFAMDEQAFKLWGLEKSGEVEIRRPLRSYPSCRSRPCARSVHGNARDRRVIRDRFPHHDWQ